MRPIVLSIAGSDSCGGAGLQADLKAIEASGGYAATAVTAITAQNTRRLTRVEPLPADLVRAQIDAVFEDLPVAAVKSGMLALGGTVREVAKALDLHRPAHYVCDPVLVATTGAALIDAEAIDLLLELLLPRATLVTPNVPEAERLSGVAIRCDDDAERAARRLIERGAHAVLIKGGHGSGPQATDLLLTPDGRIDLSGPRLRARHDHGSGCALSAAIATRLACGDPLADAVAEAKRLVAAALRHGLAIGRGAGPVDPLYARRAAGETR